MLMKRRDFLKTTALATAAIAGSPLQAACGKEKPSVKHSVQRYQEIGKTGLKMSDIAQRLAISESDLYRKQRAAIDEVARLLTQMEQQALPLPAGPRPIPMPGAPFRLPPTALSPALPPAAIP